MYDPRETGSPFEKRHGWWALSAHACAAAAADADCLTIANKTGAVAEWYDAAYDSAFIFKPMSGDFDAHTRLVNAAFTDDDRWAYFVVQESAAATNWVAIAWVCAGGAAGMRVLSTASGTTTVAATTATWYRYARIARAGDAWTFGVKAAAGDAWTTLHGATRALTDPLRIGFTHSPRDAGVPTAGVSWDYLLFASGGLTTCDMTLDGGNGCRAHCNTTRYGGAPALPRGRIM